MPRSNNQPPTSWEDSAIRAAYEQYGVEGFYQRFGGGYRNPHERVIRGKETVRLSANDLVVIETCGGGGYGPPAERSAELRARDRAEGDDS